MVAGFGVAHLFTRFSAVDYLIVAFFVVLAALLREIEDPGGLKGWIDDRIADVWFVFRPKAKAEKRARSKVPGKESA